MMAGVSHANRKYHGLLDCPLRRDIIEFEYVADEMISKLTVMAKDSWGTPTEAIYDEHARFTGYVSVREDDWVILCKDKRGAYRLLGKNERIPTSPPEYSPHPWLESIGLDATKDADFVGVVLGIDVYKMGGHKWSAFVDYKPHYKNTAHKHHSPHFLAVAVVYLDDY